MQLLTANDTLDCTAIAKLDLVNPAIVAETGRDFLTLLEEQRRLWSDYLCQRVLDQVGGKSSSPSSPNSTSNRCTNSIWDTTASPYTNFFSKSAHGS